MVIITTLSVTGANTYSWISGPNTSSIVVSLTASTIYSVIGTNTTTGCSSTSTVQVNISQCLGIDDNENNLAVSVYPNPATDYVTVNVSRFSTVEICDVLGRKLFRSREFEKQIILDIQNFDDGVLVVKVSTLSGKTQIFRVMKK